MSVAPEPGLCNTPLRGTSAEGLDRWEQSRKCILEWHVFRRRIWT